VRFGDTFARVEIVSLVLLPHLLGCYWLSRGLEWLFWWPLAVLLLGVVVVLRVMKGAAGMELNRLLGMSGGMLVLFSVLFVAACLS